MNAEKILAPEVRYRNIQSVCQYLFYDEFRKHNDIDKIQHETQKNLMLLFKEIYEAETLRRLDRVNLNEKTKNVMRYLYEWLIRSNCFNGDLNKGILITSSKPIGKDSFLRTIVRYLKFFDQRVKDIHYTKFRESKLTLFNGYLAIKDICEDENIYSILEKRKSRNIICSTSFKPSEKMKKYFNIVTIE